MVKKLELIKDRAFEFIKKNLGKVSEYDVQNFILDVEIAARNYFRKFNLDKFFLHL